MRKGERRREGGEAHAQAWQIGGKNHRLFENLKVSLLVCINMFYVVPFNSLSFHLV